MLLQQHKNQLFESAIASEVSHARGYRSVTIKADLSRLGFSRKQLSVPTLVTPVYNASGDIATYQSRPDNPRVGKNGKAVKYETPAGAQMVIDVHPFLRTMIKDPSRPLYVTEGVKKGDSAVSQGLCCVALLGVWNWRGTNTVGGKVALPDWEQIALNDRLVYIAFDNDVMMKKPVYQALQRLSSFLESRKASVKYIYFPEAM